MGYLGSELDRIIADKQQARQSKQIKEQETTDKLESFFIEVIAPAIGEFAAELEQRGREVSKHSSRRSASFHVTHDGATELYMNFVIENNVIVYKQEFLDKKDRRPFRTMGFLSPGARELFMGLLTERYRHGY